MSRYEESIAARQPCPCGKGEVIVTKYDPDFAFGKVRYDEEITCEACRKNYFASYYDGKITVTKR